MTTRRPKSSAYLHAKSVLQGVLAEWQNGRVLSRGIRLHIMNKMSKYGKLNKLRTSRTLMIGSTMLTFSVPPLNAFNSSLTPFGSWLAVHVGGDYQENIWTWWSYLRILRFLELISYYWHSFGPEYHKGYAWVRADNAWARTVTITRGPPWILRCPASGTVNCSVRA